MGRYVPVYVVHILQYLTPHSVSNYPATAEPLIEASNHCLEEYS
jgi:hypothetical protein